MKAVIFAGGVGTRLWPLSRKKSPKQFEKVIGEKSTLQLTVDRLLKKLRPEDIYISTGKEYEELVSKQLTTIPRENVIGEPHRRDVGPAVGFMIGYLSKSFPNEPLIILWSDHMVRKEEVFLDILDKSNLVIQEDNNKMIFIAQKPRFASDNLGWIETGEEVKKIDNVSFKSFHGFKYRPDKAVAEKYFADPRFCWNLGYFVSTPAFVYGLFKEFAPGIYQTIERILATKDTPEFKDTFDREYATIEKIHFDNAIAERLDHTTALVVNEDIGWSDVGAWEALKEALETHQSENVTLGNVHIEDSTDNLVYNYQDGKLIVGVDLNELLIVNTEDVLLVAHKNSVGKVKKIVESFEGTEHEGLT